MAHLEPGMRVMEAPDWRNYNPRGIYWFDMPREAKLDGDGRVLLPDTAGAVSEYQPYAAEGFARPALPKLLGRPIGDVLAAVDALDMPFSVYVRYDDTCAGADDTVCKLANSIDETTSHFELKVAMRVRHRGLPEEQRLLPAAEQLVGRPPLDVANELKAIGFKNVVVVEKDLPCKRGTVCSVPGRDGWYGTNQPIELWVRRAK